MTQIISQIVFNSQCFVALLSFIISLRLVNNKNIPGYMKGFYWYSTIALVVAIPLFLTDNFFRPYRGYSRILNNLSLIFHYSFLSIFIIRVIVKKHNIKYLSFLFVFFLLLLIFVLVNNNLTKQLNLAFSVSNLGLTFFCIIYYYQLFNNIPTLDLRKEPSFWIITGIFFCMSAHIPITAMGDLLNHKIPLAVYSTLRTILTFCYVVMHLFFIKAYLCAIHPRKA
ncbi:MAG: hypothetical protein ABI741_15255 [Ferruginibacter sp.]